MFTAPITKKIPETLSMLGSLSLDFTHLQNDLDLLNDSYPASFTHTVPSPFCFVILLQNSLLPNILKFCFSFTK
jgi:hypothetical protein